MENDRRQDGKWRQDEKWQKIQWSKERDKSSWQAIKSEKKGKKMYSKEEPCRINKNIVVEEQVLQEK